MHISFITKLLAHNSLSFAPLISSLVLCYNLIHAPFYYCVTNATKVNSKHYCYINFFITLNLTLATGAENFQDKNSCHVGITYFAGQLGNVGEMS